MRTIRGPLLGGLTLAASATLLLSAPTAGADQATLRDAGPDRPLIGTAAWGQRDLIDYDRKNPTTYQQLIGAQFDSITPENDMKWAEIHPEEGVYDFSGADAVMEFAKRNGQQVRGHTLLWHSQNPAWVTEASATWTCDEARAVLKDHITTVVGRYKNKIYEWDVANEIYQDTWDVGGVRLRTNSNPFLEACADDPEALIGDAFRWAHKADPKARLFLNDYNAEGINEKTDAYYGLAKRLLADGVPLHGFGAQAHLSLQYDYDNGLEANLERFAKLGLKVAITEADVRIPEVEGREPTDEEVAEHTNRHVKLLKACLDNKACTSFTVWGFNDAYSWVPQTFDGEGWATLMTADGQRKPAFYAMVDTLEDAVTPRLPKACDKKPELRPCSFALPTPAGRANR